MAKQTVYVVGYPKSGTTYLTRLLGDILNSPTGGCMPELDRTEIATEGQDRPGDYIIRKGHYTLVKDDSPKVICYPHKLNYQRLTDEKIVIIIRDPRDICISGAYHWRTTPANFLDRMIEGNIAQCGRWDRYIQQWLGICNDRDVTSITMMTYEELLDSQFDTCKYTCEKLCLTFFKGRMREAIKRQSFDAVKSRIGEAAMRQNNMRKGIVGDYKNYFTQEMNNRMWGEFGWMMERLGYSK